MSKMRELNKTQLNWVAILLVVTALYILAACLRDILGWREHPLVTNFLDGFLNNIGLALPNSIFPIIIVLFSGSSLDMSLTLIWERVCLAILELSAAIPLAFLVGKWLSGINVRHSLLASVLTYLIASLAVSVICMFIAFRI